MMLSSPPPSQKKKHFPTSTDTLQQHVMGTDTTSDMRLWWHEIVWNPLKSLCNKHTMIVFFFFFFWDFHMLKESLILDHWLTIITPVQTILLPNEIRGLFKYSLLPVNRESNVWLKGSDILTYVQQKETKKGCAPGTGPISQDSATTAACSVRHEIRSSGVETTCSSCRSARLLTYSACSVRTFCRTFWNLAPAARAFSFLAVCAGENHRDKMNIWLL